MEVCEDRPRAFPNLLTLTPWPAENGNERPAPHSASTTNADQMSSTDRMEGNMAEGHSIMMGMLEGERKDMAMKEIGMAKEMMEKKDMASLKKHMTRSMGMGTPK